MDLLAPSLVLLLLLAASYSGRRAWVALGSIALTAVLVGGSVFLVTAERAGPFLETLSAALPSGWDQRTEDLAAAAGQAATALTSSRTDPAPTSAALLSEGFGGPREALPKPTRPEPTAAGSVPQTPAREPPADASTQTALPPETKPVSGNGAPVKWIRDAPTPPGTRVVLVGINISDTPLEQIRATLRPDDDANGIGTLPLAVVVEGQAGGRPNATTIVPPGARFTLERPAVTAADTPKLGGAVLSFAYVQEGRRRTSIISLAPASSAEGASAEGALREGASGEGTLADGSSADRASPYGRLIERSPPAPLPAPSSGVR